MSNRLRRWLATLSVATGAWLVSDIANFIATLWHSRVWHIIGDDFVIAGLAGWAFWHYSTRRQVVRELNHHIRNALQVVLYSPDPEEVERAKKRIEWALKEASRVLHRETGMHRRP